HRPRRLGNVPVVVRPDANGVRTGGVWAAGNGTGVSRVLFPTGRRQGAAPHDRVRAPRPRHGRHGSGQLRAPQPAPGRPGRSAHHGQRRAAGGAAADGAVETGAFPPVAAGGLNPNGPWTSPSLAHGPRDRADFATSTTPAGWRSPAAPAAAPRRSRP